MSDAVGFLSAARYGKDLVRVCRVVREGDTHYVAEYTVRALLEGDIEQSYTKADNSCVVATDTIKNTVNIFAKTSPFVLDPPMFALHLALHFTNKYSHIHKSFVDILALKWSRIEVDGKPHTHAFVRDGDEKGVISVSVDATGSKPIASVEVGMKDLLVLKTAGSAFENFYQDEFTTLMPVADRIFSTSVTINYNVPLPKDIALTLDNLDKISTAVDFAKIAAAAKETTLKTFATDDSASVQATMYNTGQAFLKAAPGVSAVSYSYPNKHYIPVNLSPFKLDNGLSYEGGCEVFHPVADPSGLITATITRK